MLLLNHTNNDVENFFKETDKEFETLESVIIHALGMIDAYEKEIELTIEK